MFNKFKISQYLLLAALMIISSRTVAMSLPIFNKLNSSASKDTLKNFEEEYKKLEEEYYVSDDLDTTRLQELAARADRNIIPKYSSEFRYLLGLYLMYYESPNSEANFEIAKNIKIISSDTSKAVSMFHTVADYFRINSRFDEVERTYIQLKELFNKNTNFSRTAGVIVLLGNFYLGRSRYIEALSEYQLALDYAVKANDKARIADCYVGLSIIHTEILNTDKSLEFLNNALTYNLMSNDTFRIAVNYANFANTYYEEKDYQKAFDNNEKARYYISLDTSNSLQRKIYTQILIQFADIYLELNKIDSAELYFKNALERSMKFYDDDLQLKIHARLLSLYQKTNRNQIEIDTLVNRIKKYNFEILSDEDRKELYYTLSEYYHRKNNFENAYQYLMLGREIAEKILNFDERRILANMEYQREVAEKQLEIDLAGIKLEKEEQQKNFVLIILSVVFVFLVVLVFFIRNKIKINRMLAELNSELEQKNKIIEEERAKSEHLLLNILPSPIAERLKRGEETIADLHKSVSVIFIDIVDFTELSTRVTPAKAVSMLNMIFKKFDELCDKHSIEKIKTIGDSFMAVSGINGEKDQHEKALLFAIEALEYINKSVIFFADRIIQCRCGIACGEVIAGVIGTKKFIYDIWGDTVNTAARMEKHSLPGRINISDKFKNSLNSGSTIFEERDEIEIKGKGKMKTWFVIH